MSAKVDVGGWAASTSEAFERANPALPAPVRRADRKIQKIRATGNSHGSTASSTVQPVVASPSAFTSTPCANRRLMNSSSGAAVGSRLLKSLPSRSVPVRAPSGRITIDATSSRSTLPDSSE